MSIEFVAICTEGNYRMLTPIKQLGVEHHNLHYALCMSYWDAHHFFETSKSYSSWHDDMTIAACWVTFADKPQSTWCYHQTFLYGFAVLGGVQLPTPKHANPNLTTDISHLRAWGYVHLTQMLPRNTLRSFALFAVFYVWNVMPCMSGRYEKCVPPMGSTHFK